MSLKYAHLFCLCFVILSCGKQNNLYNHLSEQEKNTLADYYHEKSMQYYQPSLIHRIYKDSAIMAQPKHVEYTERFSYSYKKTGEHIRAMELLNKAVELDVINGETHALQYKAWSMLYFYRDYKATIEDVDKIEQMNSPHSYNICHGEPCLLLKAQALYQLKEYSKSLACFKQLLKVEENQGFEPKDNFFARFYMARIYTATDDIDQAKKTYQNLIEDFPNFTEAHYYLGLLYLQQQKKPLAKTHFDKAKKLLSENYKVIQEPYIERFDEVFIHEVDEVLEKINRDSLFHYTSIQP